MTTSKNGRIQFGANQALLVRNEEAKRNLPEPLKDAICFTIMESKGLEFDDVFLFDYFATSSNYLCWNYLSQVNVTELEFGIEDYEELMRKKELMGDGSVDGLRILNSIFL